MWEVDLDFELGLSQGRSPSDTRTKRRHGCLPVTQHLGSWEVPGDGLSLLCHGWYRRVGHAKG